MTTEVSNSFRPWLFVPALGVLLVVMTGCASKGRPHAAVLPPEEAPRAFWHTNAVAQGIATEQDGGMGNSAGDLNMSSGRGESSPAVNPVYYFYVGLLVGVLVWATWVLYRRWRLRQEMPP